MKSFFLVLVLLSVSCHFQSEKKLPDNLNKWASYKVVKGWGILPDNIKIGKASGVDVDSHGHVFIFHRGSKALNSNLPAMEEEAVLVLENSTGHLIRRWGSHRFVIPHGITIDSHDNIWITDIGLHQVFKFNHDGELLLTLGKAGVSGSDSHHFNGPTDVEVLKDGTFFISDGYVNNRILKFSPSGKLLDIWGGNIKGNKPGQFDLPHSIDSDKQERIYIADLINKRIQIFDRDGRFLTQWSNPGWGIPYSVKVFASKRFIVDGGSPDARGLPLANRSGVFQVDEFGNIKGMFGKFGQLDGEFLTAHDIAEDGNGALYVAEINGRRIQKFVQQ